MTISIGGNDAQFATVFLFCLAYPECHRIKPFEGVSDLVLGDLAPLLIASAGLKVLDVHTRLHDALPDATVVVLGYPILLSGAECPAVRFPPSAKSGVKLSSSEQAFLREMNASLNTVIAESAAIAGLHHVAVADRFTGHEICGVADDWINGTAPLLTPWFNPKATVHPTARGQLEYANALNAYLASTSTSPPNGLLPQGLPRNPAPAAGARRILAQRAAATRTDLPAFGALQVAFAVPGTGCEALEHIVVPGQDARLRGDGFAPGETVSISIVLAGRKRALGTAQADGAGALDVTLPVPAQAPVGQVVGVEALGAGPLGQGRLLIDLVKVEASASLDGDGDGIPDLCDNCSAVANADQRDADGDGYGSLCDADLDNDGLAAAGDATRFREAWGRQGEGLAADFDGNFAVDDADLAILRALRGRPPGLSYTVVPAAQRTARHDRRAQNAR